MNFSFLARLIQTVLLSAVVFRSTVKCGDPPADTKPDEKKDGGFMEHLKEHKWWYIGGGALVAILIVGAVVYFMRKKRDE